MSKLLAKQIKKMRKAEKHKAEVKAKAKGKKSGKTGGEISSVDRRKDFEKVSLDKVSDATRKVVAVAKKNDCTARLADGGSAIRIYCKDTPIMQIRAFKNAAPTLILHAHTAGEAIEEKKFFKALRLKAKVFEKRNGWGTKLFYKGVNHGKLAVRAIPELVKRAL